MFAACHSVETMLQGDGRQNFRNFRIHPLGNGDEAIDFDLVHDGVDSRPRKPTIPCRLLVTFPDLLDPFDWNQISTRLMYYASRGEAEITIDWRTPLFERVP
jgi:hypothetical protein